MHDIEEMLRQTLNDWRLSRGERRALEAAVEKLSGDERQLAVARARAFEILREETLSPETKQALQWLEEVMKALLPKRDDEISSAVYFSPGDNCPRAIANLFDQTRAKADVCVFTITDDRITEAILRAHQRGVAVRIISDDDKSHDLGSDIAQLRSAKVPLRLDCSEYHMHHKFALFDGRQVLSGSYNWTRGAAEYNEENFIVTDDKQLVREFSQLFERLWKQFA